MQARKVEPESEVRPAGAEATATAPKRRIWIIVVVAILALVALVKGWQFYAYSRSHVTTDDAFLSADITQVSPQVSGLVKDMFVSENQTVKQGQLIAALDDSTFVTNVRQAQANLDLALAAQVAAKADIALTRRTTAGEVTQASGGVVQASSNVEAARADLANADAGVSVARASEGGMKAQSQVAKANLEASIQNRAKAVQAVTGAKAQLAAAQAGHRAAQAAVNAAEAHLAYATSQAQRYETLVSQGAASRQQAEAAQQDLETARDALQSAKEEEGSAQAAVAQRSSDVQSAQQSIAVSDAGIAQAKAQVQSAHEMERSGSAGLQEAIARRANVAQGIIAAQGRRTQAVGQQQVANTGNEILATKEAAYQQATAKVEQAKAALQDAKIDLQRTKIYAPLAGTVSKRFVQVGTLVQPGTPIMSLVQSSTTYVVANLKETQTAKLSAGQPAEIEVDGFPDHLFKARLESLSPATGATFALLPPDNASGNFVKVVQRIPVRLDLDPGQSDLDRLKAGMSVRVAIQIR